MFVITNILLMCFISVAATVLLITRIFNDKTLLCRAEGNPPPHVTWIGPDGEVKKTSTTTTASSLGNLGQGKYTCKATNALGSDQKSYTVTRKDFVLACFVLTAVFGCCCCCCCNSCCCCHFFSWVILQWTR